MRKDRNSPSFRSPCQHHPGRGPRLPAPVHRPPCRAFEATSDLVHPERRGGGLQSPKPKDQVDADAGTLAVLARAVGSPQIQSVRRVLTGLGTDPRLMTTNRREGKTLRSTVSTMGDTVGDVSARLRALAVELVRAGKAADAAAVLSGIGAVEMLSMFAEDQPHAAPVEQPS